MELAEIDAFRNRKEIIAHSAGARLRKHDLSFVFALATGSTCALS